MWQECSSRKYASTDGVGLWIDVTLKLAAMTRFARSLAAFRQFLIYSTFVLILTLVCFQIL